MTRARTLSKLGSSPAVLSEGAVVSGITTIDASGLNITGVVTATTFKGDVTGSATGLSGNITSSGTLSITDATASTSSSTGALVVSGGVGIAKSLFVGEGVSVAGTITYDDVTNIDSVGIVTAGKGLRATTGGLIVTAGVSTFPQSTTITAKSGGQVLVGTSAEATIGSYTWNGLQVRSTTGGAAIVFEEFNTSNWMAGLKFGKSRASSIGSYTIVQNGDNLGNLIWHGADGTDMACQAASIQVEVDGAPGSNDMPGRMIFATTADGGVSPTERMRITANGGLLLSNGILVEHCKIVTTAWSTTNDISLDDGNVFLNTANLAGTNNTIDITSTNGLNVDLGVGDMTSVTLITAVNAATAYINHITIGAASVTESWVGGSAPTAGGSSGYDVYTFNIIKQDATPTWVVIANQVKGS